VTGGRGDRVAPPAGSDDWEVRFGNNEAAKGWEELCRCASANTLNAWLLMRSNPSPTVQTSRHHRLRSALAFGVHRGEAYPQWQIEVTAGGRVWYLVDEVRRTCWVMLATARHPKATD
jgi:CubicO group peptidase (beta-lactamase class C family)